MISNIGKHWRVWSKQSKNFDIIGYTKSGGNYAADAIKACEKLSKHIKESIPGDIQLQFLNSDQ